MPLKQHVLYVPNDKNMIIISYNSKRTNASADSKYIIIDVDINWTVLLLCV